jgi:hypothetical protein
MRSRSLASFSFLLVASLGATACGGAPSVEPAPPPVASAPEPAPTEGAEPEAPAEPPAKSFAELRAAAMACPTIEDGSFDDGCAAREAWTGEQPAFEDGKANAQLLEMLVDADPRARLLAAERLRMTVHEENLDAALADRLIAAAAAERNEAVIPAMSAMLTGQNLVKVERTARVVEVAKAHPSADFRESTLLQIGFFNRDESILGWAEQASRDKDARMRNAALRAAAYQTSNFPETEKLRPRACKLVDSMRTDKDNFVQRRAHAARRGQVRNLLRQAARRSLACRAQEGHRQRLRCRPELRHRAARDLRAHRRRAEAARARREGLRAHRRGDPGAREHALLRARGALAL